MKNLTIVLEENPVNPRSQRGNSEGKTTGDINIYLDVSILSL